MRKLYKALRQLENNIKELKTTCKNENLELMSFFVGEVQDYSNILVDVFNTECSNIKKEIEINKRLKEVIV